MSETRCVAGSTERGEKGEHTKGVSPSRGLLALERAVKVTVQLTSRFDHRRRILGASTK